MGELIELPLPERLCCYCKYAALAVNGSETYCTLFRELVVSDDVAKECPEFVRA